MMTDREKKRIVRSRHHAAVTACLTAESRSKWNGVLGVWRTGAWGVLDDSQNMPVMQLRLLRSIRLQGRLGFLRYFFIKKKVAGIEYELRPSFLE